MRLFGRELGSDSVVNAGCGVPPGSGTPKEDPFRTLAIGYNRGTADHGFGPCALVDVTVPPSESIGRSPVRDVFRHSPPSKITGKSSSGLVKQS